MRFNLLAILAFTVSPSARRCPPGVQKKASVGASTSTSSPTGLRGTALSDPANPKDHGQHDRAGGLAPRRLRRDGDGASPGAHGLHRDQRWPPDQERNRLSRAVWNGTTSEDRTNYYETFTASDDNLKWALDLEAARLVNVKINKQLLDVEMTVVRNEFERGENSPQRVLSERVASTAFLWHNYGKRLSLARGSGEGSGGAPARLLQEVLPAR
jgi:zinc protease